MSLRSVRRRSARRNRRRGMRRAIVGSGPDWQWWADGSAGNTPDTVTGATELAYDGTPYLWLPGVADNYASTPDSAALDVTGDLSVRAHVALDDWTPASAQAIATKRSGAANRSWQFYIDTAGRVNLQWSEDGATFESTAQSTAAPTVDDGAFLWLRADLDVDDGASSANVTFYTSTDGLVWTQLGDVVDFGAVTSIFSGDGDLEIGSYSAGTAANLTGKVARLVVYNGLTGSATMVADFAASDPSSSNLTEWESATTGETWTVSRSATKTVYLAHVVQQACYALDGSNDYLAWADADDFDFGTDDFLVAVDAFIPTAITAVSMIVAHRGAGFNVGWNLQVAVTGVDQAVIGTGAGTVQDVHGTAAHGDAVKVHAMRRQGDELEVFMDGTGTGTPGTGVDSVDLTNANELRVGRAGGAGSNYLQGFVYGVRIWAP